jgi:hypothetical protein
MMATAIIALFACLLIARSRVDWPDDTAVAERYPLAENGVTMLRPRRGSRVDSYHINIEQRPQYLYVTVGGDNTVDTIARYMAEIRAACVRLRIFKVLVVGHLQGPGVSMLDLYKVVAAASDEAAGTGIRAAYVELNPIRSDENMRMAENVAHTRGIPVRTFRDVRTAEEWLLAEPGH